MGVIWWGTGGTCPPPTFGSEEGQNIWCPPPPPPPTHTHTHTFGDGNKITYFNICVLLDLSGPRFHSIHIQIFWACTVYIGWEETEIRTTMTFPKNYGVGCPPDLSPPPPPRPRRGFALTALAVCRTKHFYNSIVPPPSNTFFLQTTPMRTSHK